MVGPHTEVERKDKLSDKSLTVTERITGKRRGWAQLMKSSFKTYRPAFCALLLPTIGTNAKPTFFNSKIAARDACGNTCTGCITAWKNGVSNLWLACTPSMDTRPAPPVASGVAHAITFAARRTKHAAYSQLKEATSSAVH